MKNKFIFSIYLLFILITVFLAYNYYSKNNSYINEKTILSPNLKIFAKYKESFDTNKSLGYIWGLKDEVTKKVIVENNETNISKIGMLQVVKKDSSICVKKDCFRFLGVFTKKDKPYISLYSKNFKHKIDDFSVGNLISYSLYVKSVTHSKVTIEDKNSSREWSFQLFDVNATKYKPKDINETYL